MWYDNTKSEKHVKSLWSRVTRPYVEVAAAVFASSVKAIHLDDRANLYIHVLYAVLYLSSRIHRTSTKSNLIYHDTDLYTMYTMYAHCKKSFRRSIQYDISLRLY